MADSKSILICGVGGQGTVLASKVISAAAMARGKHVLSAETIGMAQRGGSVVSHVRIGDDIMSPLVPEHGADCLIAFEASEAVRNIGCLKPDATVIVSNVMVQPVTASLSGKTFSAETMTAALKKATPNVIEVDTERACAELGSAKVVNMLLLGAACRAGVLDLPDIQAAMRQLVKPQFHELNMRALSYA